MGILEDLDIEELLEEMHCDITDLIDVIESKLKDMDKQGQGPDNHDNDGKTYTAEDSSDQENEDQTEIDSFKEVLFDYSTSEKSNQQLLSSVASDIERDSSPTVPEGWKTRIVDQKTLYLSPDGSRFSSIKQVYQHMIDTGYSAEEIEEIICLLRQDGWKDELILPSNNYGLEERTEMLKTKKHEWLENEFLPEGWHYKEPRSNCSYLWIKSSEGDTLKSNRQVLSYLKARKEYSKKDVERFLSFPGRVQKTEKVSIESKTKDKRMENKYLPDSVKKTEKDSLELKTLPKKKLLEKVEKLYPDRVPMKSKSAYKWMKNNYLPEGWLFKKPKSGYAICLKSMDGTIFNSYKDTFAFFNSNEEYSYQDIEKLHLFPDGASLKSKSNLKRSLAYKWMKSNYLPEGWLFKKPRSGYAVCVKSLDGTIFNSYKAVDIFLKSNGDFTDKNTENLVAFQDEYRSVFANKPK